MTFDEWFKGLCEYGRGVDWHINDADPESYKDMFEDEMSFDEVVSLEASYGE